MTEFQALFIKYLRVKCGGTWRWIDLMYKARYIYNLPFNELFHTDCSQLNGMMYCDVAMSVLNEKIEDGWN